MTGSQRSGELLSDWERSRHFFWQVVTQAEAARQSKADLPHISVPAAFEQPTPLSIAAKE
jgi:hypothetical protein